jgi:carbonic anhydrase
VLDQVKHVCETTAVQDAWERGQILTVHGLIYDIADGLLSDLGMSISNTPSLHEQYFQALARLGK